jgi:hypothetical protein
VREESKGETPTGHALGKMIARNGRVLARFLDPDFRRRMPLDDIMNALRAAFAR